MKKKGKKTRLKTDIVKENEEERLENKVENTNSIFSLRNLTLKPHYMGFIHEVLNTQFINKQFLLKGGEDLRVH